MNGERRRALAKALELIQQASAIVEEVAEAEREAFANLPEGLQEADRGQALDANADALSDLLCTINDAADELEGLDL